MPTIALAARVAVGAVLVVAAVSKLLLRNADWLPTTVFGARTNLLRLLLVGAELGVAVALFAVPVAGSAAAAILLIAMTLWLFTQLGGGEAGCRCFGALSSESIGWPQIVRNSFLIGLSVVAGGSSAGANRLVGGVAGLLLGAGLVAGSDVISRVASDRRT